MDNLTANIDTGLASVHDTNSGLATDFSKRAYDLYNAGRYDDAIVFYGISDKVCVTKKGRGK